MKRKSDFSRRYLHYRMLPVFEEVEGEEVDIGPSAKQIKLSLKTMTLWRPKTIWEKGYLKIIQKIPKEKKGNEYWIMDSLTKEANRLFSGYKFQTIIQIDYE
jgi:hypothetical protein